MFCILIYNYLYYNSLLFTFIMGITLERYVVNPILVRMKESQKGTVYQSIIAMGYRSRQINDNIKNELQAKMADVVGTGDETEGANFDQITISSEFDKYPKPTFLAMKEITEDKLKWEIPDPEAKD